MTVILLQPEGARIPTELPDLAAFRAWTRSWDFPQSGRIDWISGEVEVDMSPESLNTHSTVKTALVGGLHAIVEDEDLGIVVTDSMRYASNEADLSSEPDVVVLLFETLESGRARLVPRKDEEDYAEIEGAADIVVEVISDSSVHKDTVKIPPRYHGAGVREYWIVDARSADLEFTLLVRKPSGYRAAKPGHGGFRTSGVLGRAVRLIRLPARARAVRYRLESK